MKLTNKLKLALASLLFVGVSAFGLSQVTTAHAAAVNPTPEAKVSFTFDDGLVSSYTAAAPALAQYGYAGTNYVITSCVGMTTIPNKCPADTDMPYMTWAQIKALQTTYGWEIGSHSVSHPEMSTLTAAKLEQEAANSKAAFVAQGLNPTAFATPYGDYSDKTLAGIAKYYSSHRGFADTGYNTWPYNNYLLRVQQVQYGVSVDTVKGYINQAIADHTWLILVFHEVRTTPSTNPEDYQYATADLSAIAAYVKSQNVKVTNITNGLVSAPAADNKVTDPTATTIAASGWTTDAVAANVAIDTKSNGVVGEPTKSLKVASSATVTEHLYTPYVTVVPGNTYVIKGYANVTTLGVKGEVGFYVDEYDINGNWISGKYVQTINALYMKDISFAYVPSSSLVAKAQLQIILASGAGTTVYFDNVQWFATTNVAAPVVTNLLTNGSFETGLTSWTNDAPNTFVADSANHGAAASSPQYSLKITAPAATATKNAHMFSSKVAVTSQKSYRVSGYLSVTTLTSGEVAFYVDEYDINGNWISGQYLYAQRSVATGGFSFNYTPTSANVANASLQIIVEKGSGITGYIDNLAWTTV